MTVLELEPFMECTKSLIENKYVERKLEERIEVMEGGDQAGISDFSESDFCLSSKKAERSIPGTLLLENG